MRTLNSMGSAAVLISLCACNGSDVVLQRTIPTSTQAIGPLVPSPKGRITLSIAGIKGVPNHVTISFTQSGLTAIPLLSYKGNTCFTSPPATTNIVQILSTDQSLADGTFTQSYDVRAQTHNYCLFTVTSAAGNKTATIPFTINL